MSEKYVGKVAFEKIAGSDLPHSVQEWDSFILTKLMEEHPYVTDGSNAIIDWKEQNEEKGDGFGAIMVRVKPIPPAVPGQTPEEIRSEQAEMLDTLTAAIPLVVKDFELRPMDVFIYENKYYPLNETAWMVNTSGFAMEGKFRGKIPDQSVGPFTNPPASADGLDRGRILTADERTVNDRLFTLSLGNTLYRRDQDGLRRHLEVSPTVVAAYAKNRTIGLLKKIIDMPSLTEKEMESMALNDLPANVIKVEKVKGNRYSITTTPDKVYSPTEIETDYSGALRMLKKIDPSVAGKLDSGDTFVLINRMQPLARPVCLEDMSFDIQNIKGAGEYIAVTNGEEIIKGVAIDNVMDFSGKVIGPNLFTDGNFFTLQDMVASEKVSPNFHPTAYKSFYPNTNGTFWWMDEDGVYCLLPFKIKSTFRKNGKDVINAVDYWKNPVEFIVTPEVNKLVSISGIKNAETNEVMESQRYYVPSSWGFMQLGRRKSFLETPQEVKNLMAKNMRTKMMCSRFAESEGLEITSLGGNRYSMSGRGVEDVYAVPRMDDCGHDKVGYLLAVMGCNSAHIESILSKAKRFKKITVGGLRRVKFQDVLKEAGEGVLDIDEIKINLVKEASILHDEDSVDKLLSLNFINARNIQEFIYNLPAFQHVERKLAELLVLARLGLRDIPEEGVANALKSLSRVNKRLAVLRDMIQSGAAEESEEEDD